MQIKVIFLIFVFVLVVVLAEEKNNKEKEASKENENGDTSLQVSGNNSEQLEEPQYPDDSRLFNPLTILLYFLAFKRELEKLIHGTDKLLESREKNIEEKEEDVKLLLKDKFSDFKLSVSTQQAKEVYAVILTSENDEIKHCFYQWLQFNFQMRDDYQSALQCIKDSAEETRKILRDSREAFNKTTTSSSSEVNHWVELVKSCAQGGNGYCIQVGITVLRKNINKIRDETKTQTEEFEKAAEKLRRQMDNCRKKFVGVLKKGKGDYIPKMRECFNVSEPEDRRR